MDIELQPLVTEVPPPRVPPRAPLLTWLPLVSVCIGTFALCFQVFVLYPWHLELSSQFAELQRDCITLESRGGM